jgi:hypothetical protein
MKSAAESDDQARSPAAERLRRRFNGMSAAIIMGAAYKGMAGVRQRRRSCGRDAIEWPHERDIARRDYLYEPLSYRRMIHLIRRKA